MLHSGSHIVCIGQTFDECEMIAEDDGSVAKIYADYLISITCLNIVNMWYMKLHKVALKLGINKFAVELSIVTRRSITGQIYFIQNGESIISGRQHKIGHTVK